VSLFVSSLIVSRIVKAAVERGVDGDALCRAAGVGPDVVRDIDGQVEIGPYLRLWSEVTRRVADPGFPLSIARSWNKGHNLLRFVCGSSPTVGDALERSSRYLRLLTNAVTWPLERGDDVSVLAMVRAADVVSAVNRAPDEFGCAEVVTLIRAFTGVSWDPREVRFAFPEPADSAAHRDFFGCAVLFAQPRTEIHLSTSALALPLLGADPSVVAFFESYIEKRLGVVPVATSASVADQVKEVLAKNLRGDVPTLEDVAERLAISGRTLRRRLTVEDTSFQRLVDETRFACARRHLEENHLSVAEVAFLLGFSEPSAFHRAFKRWAGVTPQVYARGARNVTLTTRS
jgi:AraC-like DNA-binding protein